MKNLENGRTILSKHNPFREQITSHWIVFKRLRAITVTVPRDMHVAKNDLSVLSPHSIEIQSHNVFICRP